jgi:hypothetical protein
MHQINESSQPEALDNCSLQATRQTTRRVSEQVNLDLLVLRYMAQRLHLHLLNLAASTVLPAVEYAQEHHNRIHRIVIYKQQEFLLQGSILFVGFISEIQKHVSPATIQEIHRVDKILIAELASNPGLLSYSSLEVRKGRWYNLVLLSDYTAKTYFKNDSTHTYAAHQLAGHYYRWIRLHNGVMPGGLVYNEMALQSTKYYTFSEVGQKPVMRELFYDGVTYTSSVLISELRGSDRSIDR